MNAFAYSLENEYVEILNREYTQIIKQLKVSHRGIEPCFYPSVTDISVFKDKFQWIFSFAKEYSKTYTEPLLVFQKEVLEKKMKHLSYLSQHYGVCFLLAVKSTNETEIINLAHKYLQGYDISNKTEYNQLTYDLTDKKIFVTSPIAADWFLDYDVTNNDACIVIDSIEQFRILAEKGIPFNYCIRINTPTLLGRKGQKILSSSRFGIDYNNITILKSIISNPIGRFKGFHMHHGSEMNTASDYLSMCNQALILAQKLGQRLEYVDLGGGLHLLSPDDLEKLVREIRKIISTDTTLVFEPGRFLSEQGGYVITRIESIKEYKDYTECVLDISNECHLKWSVPCFVTSIKTLQNKDKVFVRFLGATCSEYDSLGEFGICRNEYQNLKTGSIIIFGNISSYSSCWNHSFNGIPAIKSKVI